MRLGYNTNGLAHHGLPAALELLAALGYQSVAITLDHACLNPFADDFERQLAETADHLQRVGMRSVVETGARYLLDPRRKHEPTLVTPDQAGRAQRVDFLNRSIDAARALGSDCVSLWSGVVADDAPRDVAMSRLVDGLNQVLDRADAAGVPIGFEPEPGMLVDTMAAYDELLRRVEQQRGGDAPQFRLTLDVGHLHCQGETPIDDFIRQWAPRLVNVHIEDMRRGVHEHLAFGAGEIDFPPVVAALAEVGYDGGVHVELSRHSHVGPDAAKQAFEFLHPLVDACR